MDGDTSVERDSSPCVVCTLLVVDGDTSVERDGRAVPTVHNVELVSIGINEENTQNLVPYIAGNFRVVKVSFQGLVIRFSFV